MVTIEQIETGLAIYLDSELKSQFPESSIQKAAIGGIIALAIKKLGRKIRDLQNDSTIKFLGIFDSEGNVDIDEAYECLKSNWPADGATYKNDLIGNITLTVEDLDKIRECIVSQVS